MNNKSHSLGGGYKIRDLSRKWFPKPLKKFNKTVINEVYEIASSLDSEILDTLIDTHYFHNVLWPNFSEDSSNNHLEITIFLVLRELEVGNDCLLDIMLNDVKKLNELIKRLLGVTESLNFESNLRTQNYAFLFLGKLLSLKSQHNSMKNVIKDLFGKHITQYLPKNQKLKVDDDLSGEDLNLRIDESNSESEKAILRLKLRWFYSVVKNYMRLILQNKFDEILKLNNEYEVNFLDYSGSFLMFLIICSSNPDIRGYVPIVLKELNFTCIFHSKEVHSKLLEYINILHHFVNLDNQIHDSQMFYKFQKVIYTNFKDVNGAKDIIIIPSIYDFSLSRFKDFLKSFGEDRLSSLIKLLGLTNNIPDEFLSFDFMVEIIIKNYFTTFNMNVDYSHFNNIDEIKVWDDFNEKYLVSSRFQPQPLPPLDLVKYLSFNDFLERFTYTAFFEYKKAINSHIFQVLDRIKISIDSSSNLSVKGNSKYFARIENVQKENQFEIRGSISKKDFILNRDESVLLMEIVKPNKFSPHKRLQAYGVNSIRLTEVKNCSNEGKNKQYLFSCSSKDDDSQEGRKYEKMNYIIKFPHIFKYSNFPNIITSFKSGKIPSFLYDLFIDQFYPDSTPDNQIGEPLDLKVNCISLNILKDSYNVEDISNSKKRRKLNSQEVTNSLSHLLKFKPNSLDVAVSPIREESIFHSLDIMQSKALISGISNSITMVRTGPHTGSKKLLNSILSCLDLNYPKEKTLVVMPNKASLSELKIPNNIRLKSYKYVSEDPEGDMNYKYESIDLLLEKVDVLSQKLELSAYGFSQTCENAIVFFKQHIEPTWFNYLDKLKEDKSHISKYPFDSNIDFNGSSQDQYDKVIDSYVKIRELFQYLEILAPLKKLQSKNEEAVQYFIKHIANFLFVTSDDLLSNTHFYSGFDSIIYLNYSSSPLAQMLPVMHSTHLKRIVLLDNPVLNKSSSSLAARFRHLDKQQFELKTVRNIRSEFFDLFKWQYSQLTLEDPLTSKFNPGFRYVHQVIETYDKKEHPNVSIAEAEYVLLLYEYMLSVGYSCDDIGIVVYSPYQKALLTELFSKKIDTQNVPDINLYNEATSRDMIIQSLFGAKVKEVDASFVLPKKGNYMIGKLSNSSWKIPTGKLYICKNELLSSAKLVKRENNILAVNDYEHFARFQELQAKTNR